MELDREEEGGFGAPEQPTAGTTNANTSQRLEKRKSEVLIYSEGEFGGEAFSPAEE